MSSKRSSVYISLLAILIVAAPICMLFVFDHYVLKRNLDVFVTHSGFFQACVYILQTIIFAGTLIYIARQTNHITLQTKNIEKSVKTNTVQLMFTNHRELLSMAIENLELHNVLTEENLPEKLHYRVYLSMFLNHGFNTFTLRENGYIDDEWWAAIIEDMRHVIKGKATEKWWPIIRKYYPPRYQRFIDGQILGDQKEEKRCG